MEKTVYGVDTMKGLWILLAAAALIVAAMLLIAYICYRMAFYADRSVIEDEFAIPQGEIYEPFRDQMVAWMKETRAMPHEDMQITSFDGLTLRGRYFEYAPGAPVELMFHGYRGKADRDLCGGVQRCFALGRSALIVDQRACGASDGHVISFGINESKDCHRWIEHLIRRFGSDVRIILTGISMGASTVLLAAGRPLPPNVIGVLGDCGYTSAEDIIKLVIRRMKLPPVLAYPFVRLGAKLYGHFDLDSDSPLEAAARCKVPMMLVHGEADDFVPCEMSYRNLAACTAPKTLFTVPGAGHGLAYLMDTEGYLKAHREFFGDPRTEDKT